MTKVRHVLGISGGKDSAALAIYMKQKYPTLEVEYYNSDTGCVMYIHNSSPSRVITTLVEKDTFQY